MDQQFSLRWNNYLNQITDAFGNLRNEEDLVDVTLSCEGKKLKAHKMLLSACSTYFRDIFKDNPCQHPVIVFRNVKYADLHAIIDFMYKGEVNVLQEQLESFLGTAELLEVKGLTDGPGKDNIEENDSNIISQSEQEAVPESARQTSRSGAAEIGRRPVSVIPISTPSSPPLKKRKYSTSASHGKPPDRKQRSAVNEVSRVPVVPKIEKEEYIEDLTYDEDEDSDLACPTSSEPLLMNSKTDCLSEFNTNSNSSQDQHDNSVLATGQILHAEPGTSIEGISQESLQAEDVDKSLNEEENTVKSEELKNGSSINEMLEPGNKQSAKMELTLKTDSSDPTNINVRCTELLEDEVTLVIKDPETMFEDDKSKTESENVQIFSQQLETRDIPKTGTSKPALKSKGGVHLPKGLTVTVHTITKGCESMSVDIEPEDLQAAQPAEEYIALRSEEAKTPIHEEPYGYQGYQNQQAEVSDFPPTTNSQIVQDEPEMAEEAPELDTEQADVPLEEKEPEFDYYGCEICKAEAKPVDRYNYTHKCPICPCVCFCSHLLKEHMKVIHGWFNVQRRFKQY